MGKPREPRAEPTAADLVQRLRERHPPQEWAFFSELRGGTGFTRESRMDALAMNTWPSRGMEVHGFEVKISRQDWKRELDNPAKSAELQRFCDRWWVVTSTDALVFPGELPPTWGWMVPHGTGLRAKVEAPKLQAEPLDRAFVAAMMRRASNDDAVKEAVDAALQSAWRRWQKEAERQQAVAGSVAERELADLQKAVESFEAASGVTFRRWEAGDIGAAVKFVLEARGRGDVIRDQLRHLAEKAKSVAEHAEQAMAAWPTQEPADG